MPTRDINAVMNDHAMELMDIPGVTMVAVGELENGEPCIRVYVDEMTEDLKKKLPTTLEGHPVDIEVSGEIKPLGGD